VTIRAFIWFFLFAAFSERSLAAYAASECDKGEERIRSGQFSDAVDLLSRCLAVKGLNESARARTLQLRAWAYFNLRKNMLAVSDQEAAFKIKPPSDYREFINYSLYLRRVGRYEDSLRAVRSAEEFDQKSGQVSMMTQYHLGWTLSELGRYEEAVKAFTSGIPAQPDYPFVYWRRGLAFEALDRKEDARKDFETAARFIVESKNKWEGEDLLIAIRAKLRQYGLERKYVF
jgi:tetratricopeptide (TPR) repeat protein